MTPLDFLSLLWRDKPDALFILIWTLQGKQSFWFQSLAQAAEFLQNNHTDVYVGVGVAKQDYGLFRRCISDEIAGIAGFAADFDIKSPAHPKDLPTSIDEALTLIPSSLPPTIVIATGNGCQAWWLFKEPWIFASEAERKEAAALSSRFQTLFKYNSSERGWAFDRLSDLARVLRIPSTVNGKDPNQPKPVTVHSCGGHRYNPSELEEFLDDLAVPDLIEEQNAANDWKERFADKPLVINLSARIPQELLDRWCEADPRFKNTWFRQRPDLNDQSQSGYDMALACFGVARHLQEQQIVDLIIHHHFLHRQKQRTRIDYFQRTISKAAKSLDESVAPQSAGAAAQGEPDSPDPGIAKAQTWERISAILGIQIHRVVKITGKDPIYRMDLEGGKIEFSTVKKLVTQETFRCIIAAATNHFPAKQKPRAWEEIVRLMLSALTEEDGGEEMDLEGRALMYISQYLRETGFIDSIEGQNSQNARKPLILDGFITVCSNEIQLYVSKTTGQNVPISAITSMLSVVGAIGFRFHRKAADQTRWKLSATLFDPAQYSARYREDTEHGE